MADPSALCQQGALGFFIDVVDGISVMTAFQIFVLSVGIAVPSAIAIIFYAQLKNLQKQQVIFIADAYIGMLKAIPPLSADYFSPANIPDLDTEQLWFLLARPRLNQPGVVAEHKGVLSWRQRC